MLEERPERREESWRPPEYEDAELEWLVEEKRKKESYMPEELIFVRMEPYIDAVYVRYGENRKILEKKRLIFREGYKWNLEQENFFIDKCLNNPDCDFSFSGLNEIYARYRLSNPEWNLKRYYAERIKVLDHIHQCMERNTAKEILYKAGLDALAMHVMENDEVDLIATKPSELYDGITMRTLRAMNCEDGALMLRRKYCRENVKMLADRYPDIFRVKLNDAQCRYLLRIIEGALTIEEIGRLFPVRCRELKSVWCRSQYESFMDGERKRTRTAELMKIDPIYENFFRKKTDCPWSDMTKYRDSLIYYLLVERQKYDRWIRRTNRKKPDLEERGEKYYIRYPQTINDLCREAVYMQNCLLAYVEPYLCGDTTILFLRRADDVNTPYITIEIFNGWLLQARKRFNNPCSNEEMEWIYDFCERHDILTFPPDEDGEDPIQLLWDEYM